jgi:hypothetical protein
MNKYIINSITPEPQLRVSLEDLSMWRYLKSGMVGEPDGYISLYIQM